jgi:hypothetical protein
MNSQANVVFTKAWMHAVSVPFVKEWSNGSGMFDFAVYGEHAPKLNHGEIVASVTPGGRRIVIVGTRLGNLAVFDRYAEQAYGQAKANEAVFTRNTTTSVDQGGWFSGSVIDDYEMEIAVGNPTEIEPDKKWNLGERLEQLYSGLKKSS